MMIMMKRENFFLSLNHNKMLSPWKKKKMQIPRNNPMLLNRTNPDVFEKSLEYDASDPKYALWVPPKEQTGDGRTSLNDKLGY